MKRREGGEKAKRESEDGRAMDEDCKWERGRGTGYEETRGKGKDRRVSKVERGREVEEREGYVKRGCEE